MNPRIPIEIMAKIIPRLPKVWGFPLSCVVMCEIIPNPGRIRIYTSG